MAWLAWSMRLALFSMDDAESSRGFVVAKRIIFPHQESDAQTKAESGYSTVSQAARWLLPRRLHRQVDSQTMNGLCQSQGQSPPGLGLQRRA